MIKPSSILLDKLQIVTLDEDGHIGKIVQVADPSGGSCTAIATVNPIGFRSRGLAYLTGSTAGTAVFFEDNPSIEGWGVDVSELVKIATSEVAPQHGSVTTKGKIMIARRAGITNLVMQCFIGSIGNSSLVVHGPIRGQFVSAFELIEIGDLVVEWIPLWL